MGDNVNKVIFAVREQKPLVLAVFGEDASRRLDDEGFEERAWGGQLDDCWRQWPDGLYAWEGAGLWVIDECRGEHGHIFGEGLEDEEEMEQTLRDVAADLVGGWSTTRCEEDYGWISAGGMIRPATAEDLAEAHEKMGNR